MQDSKGQTPLHLALRSGIKDWEALKLLVNAKILHIKDNKGKKPLDLISDRGLSGSLIAEACLKQ